MIHATSTAELLDVDARHQTPQAVADQVDPTATYVTTQVVSQCYGSPFDSFARAVVEGQNLAKAAPAKVGGHWEKSGSIGKVAVNQNDSALHRFSGRRAA